MSSVLITGANRGLGLEFATEYATDGWQVFATCRRPVEADQLKDLTRKAGHRASVLAMDVIDIESIRNAATQLKDAAIDVLINNAGIGGPRGQTTGNVDYEAWAHVLDVNTMGPLRVLEAFTEQLARSERKLVVTLSSGMASIADNTSGGSIPYRSSKAAMNMVMRSAAIDLAPRGITCVLLSPGWVKTDMGGPAARLTPHQSVSAMRRLIAKMGRQDSGKFLHYDGRAYPW
jgi:NAD(P)-dependent dehydrogenase (short-subunit alcohol dehydrogenase family)